MSLLNLEIILPEAAFKALGQKKTQWMGKSWADKETPGLYEHDQLQIRVDWDGNPKELV